MSTLFYGFGSRQGEDRRTRACERKIEGERERESEGATLHPWRNMPYGRRERVLRETADARPLAPRLASTRGFFKRFGRRLNEAPPCLSVLV